MKHKLGFDLILLGDPASGKDTQASLLMQKYNLTPVETGKQWRKMVKINNFYGKWLKRTFGQGYPAPVKIVKWFLKNKITKQPKEKDLIFIGNPRLKPEAQFLKKILKNRQRDFFVVYLRLSVKEIFRRAQNRVVQEDTKKITERRIVWTKEQVSKTVKYFQSLKKLKLINGNKHISKVHQDILKAINDYK